MKAAQISQPGGDWEIVDRPIPAPPPEHVRIKVEACGICHSDMLVKEGLIPGIQYPRVPGHEVAGVIDAVGSGVALWRVGDRVGIGWHGGHCFHCPSCRGGDFAMCQTRQTTGLSFDGGYAEYMIAPAEAVASIPASLRADEAAPLLCAGITVFNALRNSGARAGDLVGIQGLGGLGHLGVQYARQMGFETVAVGRGKEKEPLAKKLGAHHYLDTADTDAATGLNKLGGARLILATAPDAKAISGLVGGLAPSGKLLIAAAPGDPLTVSAVALIGGRNTVAGWYSGVAKDSEDTLRFSALSGVRPMIETYPLSKVGEAYQRMISSQARFRVVLTM